MFQRKRAKKSRDFLGKNNPPTATRKMAPGLETKPLNYDGVSKRGYGDAFWGDPPPIESPTPRFDDDVADLRLI
jgi:hypothetical protein